jgi:3-vinyl bacteriochlorophyllide hydratase
MSDHRPSPTALYTREQRWRRDHTPWTLVQGVLAPFQFLVFLVSLVLVGRTLVWGVDAHWALWSVVVKTAVLYLIMVTGSIWEKKVFGQYLFAASFFWEDVVSMGVMVLHTAYVLSWLNGWLDASELLWLALAAYASYVVNAAQFVWKLRLARLSSESTQVEDLRPSASRYGRVT